MQVGAATRNVVEGKKAGELPLSLTVLRGNAKGGISALRRRMRTLMLRTPKKFGRLRSSLGAVLKAPAKMKVSKKKYEYEDGIDSLSSVR